MTNKYTNDESDIFYKPKMVYKKPKLIIINKLLPPVTVNFSPPAVRTCLENKLEKE